MADAQVSQPGNVAGMAASMPEQPLQTALDESSDPTSETYVGQWNRLVSTTNWEKGRIIFAWRTALLQAGAEVSEYSDEAWSRRVGGVTGQHVGRLRRVFERFGASHTDFDGLYWSHFLAAVDWDDAQLWLEGASRTGWSVPEMRRQRWQAMGALPAEEPRDDQIVAAETDEDHSATEESGASRSRGDFDESQAGPLAEGPDFGDEPIATGLDGLPGGPGSQAGSEGDSSSGTVDETGQNLGATCFDVPLVRPFENLAELPADLAEAFENFKLAILRHKADDWKHIARDDLLGVLEALKQLACAPSPE